MEGREGAGDKTRSARVSVSNENNVLLDPEVLTDFSTQALVLTALATLVKYTNDEGETRILYEYLAEASVVFPRVFPVIHSLLDAKLTTVLLSCHDQAILGAVQSIIQNMIACEDASQQQLHYLQSCGFGGLWRFAGPFTKSNCTAESAELFVNCLEAMVETCLPGGDDVETTELSQYLSMLSVSSNMNLSSSLSSLTLGSPTEKEQGRGEAASGGSCPGLDGMVGSSQPTPSSVAQAQQLMLHNSYSSAHQRSLKCSKGTKPKTK
ncbi:hypothetical protein J437_LFUL013313 [Ladona fulva]|uniref:Neurofibromin n=1 Tax=Ladona fulva TaxID=123851 RepID=A0A8K0KD54_LADFU|nr:hypothetical protein J437_LFUL013313 [Ladona fulva]